jgi:hypothetical protein
VKFFHHYFADKQRDLPITTDVALLNGHEVTTLSMFSAVTIDSRALVAVEVEFGVGVSDDEDM